MKIFNIRFIAFILLFAENNIFAQDYFLNLKFSGLLSSSNYKNIGEISADVMIPLFEKNLDLGLFVGDISSTLKGDEKINDAFIQKTFIGIAAYYNYPVESSTFIPFIGLKGAYLFRFVPDPSYGYYYESTPYSSGYYDHYTEDDFMIIFSVGSKIAFSYSENKPDKFIIIVGLDYQIRKFNLKYVELFETDNSDYLSHKYHSENMLLDAIRWSIGLQIDF